jgi:hypothetical protein
MSALIPLMLLACFSDDEDTATVSSMPSCEETPTALALEEQTALGFSAGELLAMAEGLTETELLWAVDGTSALSIEVSHQGGEARYITSVAVYPDDGGATPAIGVVCEDRVEIDVSVTFQTDEGTFNEAWDGTLRSSSGEADLTASLYHELDLDAMGGSFAVDGWAPEGYADSAVAWIDASFDADGNPSGEVAGYVSGEDGEVAWAETFEVATWPADAEQ